MTAKRIFGTDTKTTWVGVGGLFLALAALVKCFIGGIDVMCLLIGFGGVMNSVGNILSKDFDATGGTVPVTEEAKKRVDSPPLTDWGGKVSP